MARGDLTDEQWTLIEPHLPIAAVGPIPDLRQHFNAVMWRFRVGGPWRDLPTEFGPWQSAYDRFRIWAKQGVLQQLMAAVIAEAAARGETDLSLVSVDSATARAHHHAAGMALDPEQLAALEAAVEAEKGSDTKGQQPQDGQAEDDSRVERQRVRRRHRALWGAEMRVSALTSYFARARGHGSLGPRGVAHVLPDLRPAPRTVPAALPYRPGQGY